MVKDKLAFIFPGQGAQFTGMGKDLYQACPESKAIFERADRVLGFKLSELCFQGNSEELNRTINCQPAIFTVSLAALAALKQAFAGTISCFCLNYMAGLSLGEYSALAAAEAFSFEEGIVLVAKRAALMDEAAAKNPGKMSSILGLGLSAVEQIAKETKAEIANLNCPGQVVISGSIEAVDHANELAKERGARRIVGLEVSGGFHSSLMEPASRRLAELLKNIDIKKPKVPVICNVSATFVDSPKQIKENLVRQLTGSVLWERSVRYMIEQGVNKFFEIGPGKVLKGLIRKINPDVEVVNISGAEDIQRL